MNYLVAFVMLMLAGIIGGFFGYLFGFWGIIPSGLLGVVVGIVLGEMTSDA